MNKNTASLDPKTVTRIAARANPGQTNQAQVPSLARVDPEHMRTLSTAMADGYWSQISGDSEVAKIMDCEALTPAQGARMAEIAKRIMGTEKPKGAPWEGWAAVAGIRRP